MHKLAFFKMPGTSIWDHHNKLYINLQYNEYRWSKSEETSIQFKNVKQLTLFISKRYNYCQKYLDKFQNSEGEDSIVLIQAVKEKLATYIKCWKQTFFLILTQAHKEFPTKI